MTGAADAAAPVGARAAPAPPVPPSAAARAAGVAGAKTATVVDRSRSHWVHLVGTRPHPVVVKQVRPDLAELGRTLAHEAFVYRLAAWVPALTAALPAPLLVDEQGGVLVLEALDAVAPGRAGEAAAVARKIAAVHRATTVLPIPFPASSGILDLPSIDPATLTLALPGHALAVRVRGDPELAGALSRARDEWRPSALTHSDLKWDNVLFTPGPDRGVRLVDWELAGHGDPAWDVACWLAQGVALGTDHDALGSPAFVRSYAEGFPCDEAFWSRCARYTPPRLLHLALETADAGGDPAPLVAAARDLAPHHRRTAATLAAWAR